MASTVYSLWESWFPISIDLSYDRFCREYPCSCRWIFSIEWLYFRKKAYPWDRSLNLRTDWNSTLLSWKILEVDSHESGLQLDQTQRFIYMSLKYINCLIDYLNSGAFWFQLEENNQIYLIVKLKMCLHCDHFDSKYEYGLSCVGIFYNDQLQNQSK